MQMFYSIIVHFPSSFIILLPPQFRLLFGWQFFFISIFLFNYSQSQVKDNLFFRRSIILFFLVFCLEWVAVDYSFDLAYVSEIFLCFYLKKIVTQEVFISIRVSSCLISIHLASSRLVFLVTSIQVQV